MTSRAVSDNKPQKKLSPQVTDRTGIMLTVVGIEPLKSLHTFPTFVICIFNNQALPSRHLPSFPPESSQVLRASGRARSQLFRSCRTPGDRSLAARRHPNRLADRSLRQPGRIRTLRSGPLSLFGDSSRPIADGARGPAARKTRQPLRPSRSVERHSRSANSLFPQKARSVGALSQLASEKTRLAIRSCQ